MDDNQKKEFIISQFYKKLNEMQSLQDLKDLICSISSIKATNFISNKLRDLGNEKIASGQQMINEGNEFLGLADEVDTMCGG